MSFYTFLKDPLKIQMMDLHSKFRKKIEDAIGQKLLKKYCKEDGTTVAKMFPPIPDSKFIDMLPQGVVLEGVNAQEKEHQNAYAAEVRV